MLDQLIQIVQQQAQSSVIDNTEVPNEHNEAVMEEASNSIFSGLQKMISEGQTNEVASLLKGDDAGGNESAMNLLSGDFISNITEKLGINKSTATSIAASLIPMVLKSLSSKAQDPSDSSLSFGNILSSLQGGSSSGSSSAISSIGGMLGLDKDNDGDVDLGDVFKMF